MTRSVKGPAESVFDPEWDGGLDAESTRGGSRVWRSLRRDPGFWIGGGLVSALVMAAVGADVLSPFDPNFAIRGSGLTTAGDPVGPGGDFLLGTDRLGRDYLSRLLHGARTSLTVGIGANVVATLLGATVGATAGFFGSFTVGGGRLPRISISVDSVLMRLTDVVLSLPALLLAIALVAVVGPSLLVVTAVIGGLLWTTTSRVVYTRVRLVRSMEFVTAARAIGTPTLGILLRHVIPHIVSVVVVYAMLGVAAAISFEAGLSFLGVGVPPPAASWGVMISEHASYYRTDTRLLWLPGLAIMLTVLAFNLIGDAFRDAFDPRSWD